MRVPKWYWLYEMQMIYPLMLFGRIDEFHAVDGDCDQGCPEIYLKPTYLAKLVSHRQIHNQTTTERRYNNNAIYIYNPLYTNWPITNADLPHVIIQYILYFICQMLYWTVSGQLSNIGYFGQFHNEARGTLRTRYRRTKAVSMYLMKILSIFLHLRIVWYVFA